MSFIVNTNWGRVFTLTVAGLQGGAAIGYLVKANYRLAARLFT
jgi:hypothetical protein